MIKDRAEAMEQKKTIERQIVEYVQTNKLESMQLKISDGIITFAKKTTQKPLTQKYLRETLEKYAEENPAETINHVKILEYIVSNLEKKVDYSINRNVKDVSS